MAKEKYKRMTQKEKNKRAKIRAELREEGILHQIKPRLNRKKFSTEVNKEFQENFQRFSDIENLYEAISWMNPGSDPKLKVTSDQLGVLKLLKIAVEIKKFKEELISKGETKYSPVDLYDEVVSPILKL